MLCTQRAAAFARPLQRALVRPSVPSPGAVRALSGSGMIGEVQKKDELVQIVDENDTETRGARRQEMREEKLIHRCSFVFVYNPKGQLFVQKRVSWKETYPSHYDPAPGGVVGAGESYEDNAAREVEEEMGVKGVALEPLFKFFFEDDVTRLWGKAFRCVYSGPITLQESEVESGEFLDWEQAKHLVATKPCCPDSRLAFELYSKKLADGTVIPPVF